jgi:enediyne biosynthesis protein E4
MNFIMVKTTAITLLFALLLYDCTKNAPNRLEQLPASTTHIDFTNVLDTTKNFRALYYFYYFNGGGVATGDINNDGLIDIYFTANSKGSNKLYLNKGNLEFEDITQKAGVGGIADWSSGVTMVDINDDGYLDIYVASVNNLYGQKGHNALYINQKNNTFIEKSTDYGLDISTYTTQTAFFDYDADGDLDCYVLNQSLKPSENLRDTSFRHEYSEMAGDRLLRNDVVNLRRSQNQLVFTKAIWVMA